MENQTLPTSNPNLFETEPIRQIDASEVFKHEYTKEKIIDLQDIKETPEKVKFNFFAQNQDATDFFAEPTNSNAGAANPIQPKPVIGEEFGIPTEPRKPKEHYLPMAVFIMKTYNSTVSSGLKMWAGAGSADQFALEKDQEKYLADMLAEVMSIYDKRVNPLYVFIGGLLFMTLMNVWSAYQIRKEVKAKEAVNEKTRKEALLHAKKKIEDYNSSVKKNTNNSSNETKSEPVYNPVTVTELNPREINQMGITEPKYTNMYRTLGYTELECMQGFYFTKTGRKLPIKFDERGLPKPKIGKQPKI